jgi:molecular chaperone DnaK
VRAKVESALSDLKRVITGDDKDVIDTKANALTQAASAIAQQAYAQANAGEAAGAEGGRASGSPGGQDDVLDAEFEEVKDKKKGA